MEDLPKYVKQEDKKEENILTPAYLKKLFRLSFKYSQGAPDIQTKIFEYLHILHPNWKVSKQLISQVFQDIAAEMQNFISPTQEGQVRVHAVQRRENILAGESTKPITPEDILAETKRKLDDLRKEFRFDINRTINEHGADHIRTACIANLAPRLLTRDHIYLSIRNGRPREFNSIPQKLNNVTDPWLSHVIYFGLEGHDTGLYEYNEMFREIGGFVSEDLAKGPSSRLTTIFEEVNRIYAEHDQLRYSLS